MKLKGDWNEETSYSIGDVVRYTNGEIYCLQVACDAGVTPIDTLYWRPVSQILAQAANFVLDIASTIEAKIPNNINDEAIVLKTETADYLITVDDSGDTPDLAVTAIEEEEEEGES